MFKDPHSPRSPPTIVNQKTIHESESEKITLVSCFETFSSFILLNFRAGINSIAPKPAPVTAFTHSLIWDSEYRSGNDIVALSNVRFTSALVIESIPESTRSTDEAQAAHVIPVTLSVNFRSSIENPLFRTTLR